MVQKSNLRDEKIDLSIEFELGKRMKSSGFAHMALLANALLFTPFYTEHKTLTIVFALLITIVSFFRVVISSKQKLFYPKNKKLWLFLFDLLLLTTAVLWGLFCVASIHYYGLVSATTSILLLIISGICAAAANSLSSSEIRAKFFIAITLSAPIASIIYIQDSLSLAFSSIFFIYAIFLFIQIKSQSKIYLNLLLTSQTTENQKKEIEAALLIAESAVKNKARFLANMSHEIRTPMNGIIGLTNLLLSSTENKENLERLKIIQNCCNTLLDLINDILDFSKLEVGKLELELYSFALNTTVYEVIELLKQKAVDKGIAILYKVETNVPKMVVGDVTRFRQILTNLISNAIKFTEKGTVEIKSRATHIEGKKWIIEYSIKDSGIGIPEELQNKLFQSFSQVDASTTRKFGGTGLGLAICKELCEKMGGDIHFESKTGVGSVFTFSFLAEESNDVEVVVPLDPFESVDKQMGLDKPLRILLVEDNRTNQLVAAGYLKKLSYFVDVASNGNEALESLRNNSYDLILMDCHMPEMDGFEATRRIKQKYLNHNCPRIIALTASTTTEDIKNCKESGMDDYIAKPITLPQLLIVLNETYSNLKKVENRVS